MPRSRTATATATATASSRHKSGVSRLLVYAPPWAVWLLVFPLACVAYVVWGRDPRFAPWMSMLAFAAVAALVPFTWRTLRARDEMLQWLGTVSTGLAGAWFIVAMLTGPLTRGILDIWAFGGFFACLFWTIRRAVISGALEQGAAPTESKLDKVLAGARIIKPKEIDGQVVGAIETNRGEQTVKDLQAKRDHLAGVLAVRPDSIRITPDPADAGRAHFAIVPTDPLTGTIFWPGPSAPGRSIADAPIPLGLYEDGKPAAVWLVGDDEAGRALPHWLVMGMNGAGKSQGWVNAMADALTRYDFELWGSDHVKGKQTFGPLLPYMARVAATLKEAKQLIAEARDETARRQADFGERGIKQWEKGCGHPLLMVWIEEASEVVADSASFVRLVERARSAGVAIVTSLQRASYDNIDTSARAQLAAALCFGVRDATDATFALPDNVLDAGAAPDAWGNRKPGYCYLVAPGIEEERWAVKMRTFRAYDPQLEAALAEHATPVDGYGQVVAGPAGAEVVSAGEEAELVDDEDGLEPLPSDLEPELNVDPDRPIGPPPVDMPLGEGRPDRKLAPEAARAIVQQHLRSLLADGRTHTQAADVGRMRPPTTMSREWIRKELIRLCEQPDTGDVKLERDDADRPGIYRMLAPAEIGA